MNTTTFFRVGVAVGCLAFAAFLIGCGPSETAIVDNQTPVDQVDDLGDHAALELTATNFKSEVLDGSNVVLVDFWADW